MAVWAFGKLTLNIKIVTKRDSIKRFFYTLGRAVWYCIYHLKGECQKINFVMKGNVANGISFPSAETKKPQLTSPLKSQMLVRRRF